MQKWEYLHFECSNYKMMQIKFNKFGEEGWEAFFISEKYNDSHFNCLLKRKLTGNDDDE